MSYIDKKMCMESLRLKLGDIIPGNDIDQVITLVDDVLIDYDITAIKKDESDTSSEQIAEFYLTTLEIQGYAKGTIDGKKRYLKKLLEFTGVPYVKMRTEHIMSFMKHEKDRGISPATIENYRHAFNAFFDFMIREELIVKNPMKRVMPFKTADIMQIPFSDTEVRLLDEGAKTDRDRAIIAFLGATGCRVAEATAVNRDDIDWQNGRLKVFGKGSKERIVYIDDVSAMLIKRYLETRKDDLPCLWLGKRGERLEPGGMRYILKEIGKKTGVKGVHPHRFRHTLATNLLKAGMPLERVQKILGHSKITTTQNYIFVDDTDVANDYRKYIR